MLCNLWLHRICSTCNISIGYLGPAAHEHPTLGGQPLVDSSVHSDAGHLPGELCEEMRMCSSVVACSYTKDLPHGRAQKP